MVELDQDVTSVWQVILGGEAQWLADRIVSFELTVESARHSLAIPALSRSDRAFATIVKNRANRGGILADGASFVNHGENGREIASRWYSATLRCRILEIDRVRARIKFVHGDAFDVCRKNESCADAIFFRSALCQSWRKTLPPLAHRPFGSIRASGEVEGRFLDDIRRSP